MNPGELIESSRQFITHGPEFMQSLVQYLVMNGLDVPTAQEMVQTVIENRPQFSEMFQNYAGKLFQTESGTRFFDNPYQYLRENKNSAGAWVLVLFGLAASPFVISANLAYWRGETED